MESLVLKDKGLREKVVKQGRKVGVKLYSICFQMLTKIYIIDFKRVN